MITGMVILNYNDSETVIKLLERLLHFDSLNYIVVVDNASTDGSFENLKKNKSPKCDMISSEKNGGYAFGNNIGMNYLIRKYNVDIIFIANPDIELEENLIKEIVYIFENNSEYSALSALMTDKKGNISNCVYKKIPTYKEDILNCVYFSRKLFLRNREKKVDFSEPVMHVEILAGSFFAIKANVMNKIGFFDEGTFLFGEERILGKKLKDNGYQAGLITTNKYKHMHSITINKYIKAIRCHQINSKSLLYYYNKYNQINKIQMLLLKLMIILNRIENIAILMIKRVKKDEN